MLALIALPLVAQEHVVVTVDFPAVVACAPGTNGLTTICTITSTATTTEPLCKSFSDPSETNCIDGEILTVDGWYRHFKGAAGGWIKR